MPRTVVYPYGVLSGCAVAPRPKLVSRALPHSLSPQASDPSLLCTFWLGVMFVFVLASIRAAFFGALFMSGPDTKQPHQYYHVHVQQRLRLQERYKGL